MSDDTLLIILGNQLFDKRYLSEAKTKNIFMAEDFGLCTEEKYHKQKIFFFLSAMRSFKDELSEIEYINWSKKYCWIYSDAFEWIRSMRKYDFVVGTRIHGIMAGIQAGVPSLCLYIDTRTKEICETMKIPHLKAANLLREFDFDYMINYINEYNWEEFDYNREFLAKNFKTFLEENEISYGKYLNKIID